MASTKRAIERTVLDAQRRLTYIADHQKSLRRLIAEVREELDGPKVNRRIQEFSDLLQKAEEARVELRQVLIQAEAGGVGP